MPIEIMCPACESRMRVPESAAGKRGKCNKCGQPILIPANLSTFDDESPGTFGDTFSPDALPASRARGPSPDSARYASLRIGMKIFCWAAMAGLVGTVFVGLAIAMMRSGGLGTIGIFTTTMWVGMLCVTGQFFVAMTGAAVVCDGPHEVRGRDVARTALMSFYGSIGVILVFLMMATMGGMRGDAEVVSKIVLLLSYGGYAAGYALLATLFGRIATHLGNHRLPKTATYYTMFLAGVSGWVLLNLFVLNERRGGRFGGGMPGEDLGMINLVVFIAAFVFHFFWFRDLAKQTLRLLERET